MLKFFTVFLSLVLLSAPVLAQDLAGNSVAVVDLQALVVKSKAAQNIGEQLESERKVILKELSDKEKVLIEEEKKLVGERDTLAKEEFAKKVQAFEKDKINLQKLSIERRNMLGEASVVAERQLMEKITEVVGEIAAEKNYALVITKQNVIVGAQSLEITDEALTRLDKAVSKIKVEFKK